MVAEKKGMCKNRVETGLFHEFVLFGDDTEDSVEFYFHRAGEELVCLMFEAES